MVFTGFGIEDDSRLFREFMREPQFKAASKALYTYEEAEGGLTKAEVWHECNRLIDRLRTLDASDRDIYVLQLEGEERRRLRQIERDGEPVVGRTQYELERSLTCILYCLCLRLECACTTQADNPHNDLLDCIVERLIAINHPVLRPLYRDINAEGDRMEAKTHQTIAPLDPLADDEAWEPQWQRVAEHYAERMFQYVATGRRDDYNRFWNDLKADPQVAAIMKRTCHLIGDEHVELGIDYNAKAMFNIIGLLYDHGFFTGIRGAQPLAQKATTHYDENKRKEVHARKDYFTPHHANLDTQFLDLSPDELEHVEGYMRV